MSDSIVLEHLVAIRESLDGNSADLSEINARLGVLCERFGSLVDRFDGLDRRVARLDEHLESIGLRIDA